MRNIRIPFIISLLVLLVGCNDAIEINQPGRLDANAAFENAHDLQLGLYGLYNQLDLTPEITFNSIFTDELGIGIQNGGQGLSDYSFALNPGSEAPASMWVRNYSVINTANRLIAASETIEPTSDNLAEYNNVMGQVYAIRAFAYFQLESYFTTDYTDDSALGVILVDFVPTIDQQLKRSSNGEIFGLITSDLDKAQNLLTVESNPTFISQDFVTALRARMAAYRQNYEKAAQYSKELLDKYPIANRDEYQGIFADSSNAEIIFKLERTVGDSYDTQGATGSIFAGGWAGSIYAFTGPGISGAPFYEIGRSLYNQFDPADIRYNVNVSESSIIDPNYPQSQGYSANDVLVIDKYAGSENTPLMNDLKVFRSSEMLLILAEADAAKGDFNGASNSTASLIKRLRDARFGTDTPLPDYSSKMEAFAAILAERRIEFAFEGQRYKDIKRLGERAGVGIKKDPLDCAFNGACGLDPTDYRFTFPLPIVEFNANPGLRDQQNPGY